MLIKSVRILPVFIILLTGFTLSFYFIKNGHYTVTTSFTDAAQEAVVSIVSTMEMMVGGSSNNIKYSDSWFSLFTFFFFMSLMCIMVLNLLIGKCEDI